MKIKIKSMMGLKKASLEDEMINLRLVSKQMLRSSKKCEQSEKMAIKKLKTSIEKGNSESARIYGQDAIREKNQALSFIKMSSRIDACSSRIETAVRMGQMTGAMQGVVNGMNNGIASMNIEKISKVMDKFEQQFEDLDVKTQYMDGVMNSTTATSTPTDQVDSLIQYVADTNNLELGEAFTDAGPIGNKVPSLKQPVGKEQEQTQQPVALSVTDDLEARLNGLRK